MPQWLVQIITSVLLALGKSLLTKGKRQADKLEEERKIDNQALEVVKAAEDVKKYLAECEGDCNVPSEQEKKLRDAARRLVDGMFPD